MKNQSSKISCWFPFKVCVSNFFSIKSLQLLLCVKGDKHLLLHLSFFLLELAPRKDVALSSIWTHDLWITRKRLCRLSYGQIPILTNPVWVISNHFMTLLVVVLGFHNYQTFVDYPPSVTCGTDGRVGRYPACELRVFPAPLFSPILSNPVWVMPISSVLCVEKNCHRKLRYISNWEGCVI